MQNKNLISRGNCILKICLRNWGTLSARRNCLNRRRRFFDMSINHVLALRTKGRRQKPISLLFLWESLHSTRLAMDARFVSQEIISLIRHSHFSSDSSIKLFYFFSSFLLVWKKSIVNSFDKFRIFCIYTINYIQLQQKYILYLPLLLLLFITLSSSCFQIASKRNLSTNNNNIFSKINLNTRYTTPLRLTARKPRNLCFSPRNVQNLL